MMQPVSKKKSEKIEFNLTRTEGKKETKLLTTAHSSSSGARVQRPQDSQREGGGGWRREGRQSAFPWLVGW